MIDPNTEALISLADAAKSCPARRGGKRPHLSCLYRWTVSGCKGIVLESIQIGGTRCTSREALARFFERLTYGGSSSQSYRSPARRQRAADRAAHELVRLGA